MPDPRCGALSMALDGLTLFLAVPADDRDAGCFQGVVPRRYVGGRRLLFGPQTFAARSTPPSSQRAGDEPTRAWSLAAMGETCLTLYVAVHKDDCVVCESLGYVPRRYVGGRPYIGLRERAADALERAQLQCSDHVGKDTHVLLEVRFTEHGVAHFMTTCAGVEQAFAPVLTKKLFYGDSSDWRVWPLRACLLEVGVESDRVRARACSRATQTDGWSS